MRWSWRSCRRLLFEQLFGQHVPGHVLELTAQHVRVHALVEQVRDLARELHVRVRALAGYRAEYAFDLFTTPREPSASVGIFWCGESAFLAFDEPVAVFRIPVGRAGCRVEGPVAEFFGFDVAVDAEPVGERPVFLGRFPVGWYWYWFSRARVTLSRFYITFFLI